MIGENTGFVSNVKPDGKDVNSDYQTLLIHAEVLWLSRAVSYTHLDVYKRQT